MTQPSPEQIQAVIGDAPSLWPLLRRFKNVKVRISSPEDAAAVIVASAFHIPWGAEVVVYCANDPVRGRVFDSVANAFDGLLASKRWGYSLHLKENGSTFVFVGGQRDVNTSVCGRSPRFVVLVSL